jgi:hypothetical protein
LRTRALAAPRNVKDPILSSFFTVLPQVIIAVVVLQLFLGLVETKWPANYYSSTDVLAKKVSRTWYRYALFRFGPVLVAAVLVAASTPDAADAYFLAALLFGVLHAAATAGRSLLSTAFRHKLHIRQALVEICIACGVLLVSMVGAIIGPAVRQYIPGIDKYVEVLLTGVVAALVYAYIGKWTIGDGSTHPSGSELLARVPQRLIDMTVRAAAREKVDRDLALAILISERIQRPGWLRVLERRTGPFARTHGPFQNMPNRDATDEQSVDAAMRTLAGSMLPREGGYSLRVGRLHYSIEKHNRSTTFVELCESVFYSISSEVSPVSEAIGEDGSPAIRLLRRRRIEDRWELLGDVSGDALYVSAYVIEPSPRPLNVSMRNGRYRRIWRTVASVDDGVVQLASSIAFQPAVPGQVDRIITVHL